ncbi:hypothetical protein ACJX0J_039017, partial [Zea mays]
RILSIAGVVAEGGAPDLHHDRRQDEAEGHGGRRGHLRHRLDRGGREGEQDDGDRRHGHGGRRQEAEEARQGRHRLGGPSQGGEEARQETRGEEAGGGGGEEGRQEV